MNTAPEYSQIFNLSKALKNEKIENKLNVICVISNPCNYKRRYVLAKLFIEQMLKNKDVELYVVECIYPKLNQTYQITKYDNPKHLQLTAETILWTKENMINLAVNKLLPPDYKAFAFIDADLQFNNLNWAEDTLKILNSCDILQPFVNGYNLNKFNKIDNNSKILYSTFYLWINKNINNYTINIEKNDNLIINNIKRECWHPGWAWAMTRNTYEKLGSIYDFGIVGGGDSILAKSIINPNFMNTEKPFSLCSLSFRKSLFDYQNKCKDLKVGYTPGTVLHYYHGTLENRNYMNRWNIIIFNKYNPYLFIQKNNCGMYEATKYFSQSFQNEIIKYFNERNEDN